jgi:predicted ATPase
VRILSFSYEDLASGWTLETATFDAMNLLVGASGVGKTQVVENLRAVVTVALLDNATLPRAKWVLYFWCVAQESASQEFYTLRAKYLDIFPSVDDLRVRRSDEGDRALLRLEIRERGIPHWIDQSSISAGMLRTLIHLHEFLFAPAGTVIVIDEFENSLGVNCLPVLTELMLQRTDCQFIVTSHHPYVIGNIPMSTWRVVQRHGSVVRLLPAQEIPRLRGGSRLDAFTRLLNALQSDAA